MKRLSKNFKIYFFTGSVRSIPHLEHLSPLFPITSGCMEQAYNCALLSVLFSLVTGTVNAILHLEHLSPSCPVISGCIEQLNMCAEWVSAGFSVLVSVETSVLFVVFDSHEANAKAITMADRIRFFILFYLFVFKDISLKSLRVTPVVQNLT
jgi:hypothetical protein